jgi:TetR/AcrR family transcriptional regulator
MAQPAVFEVPSRDKILDAAELLFARRGFAGVGLREVAEASGLGKSSLFHHFRSKTELYAAVVGRILKIFDHNLTAALAAGGDSLARFDRWLDSVVDTFAKHPTAARLLLRSLFEDDDLSGTSEEEREADETIRHVLSSLSALLKEGMQSGTFRSADIPHTIQSIMGLTVYHFASGEFGEELIGHSLFSPTEVRRRKNAVKALLYGGLLGPSGR